MASRTSQVGGHVLAAKWLGHFREHEDAKRFWVLAIVALVEWSTEVRS